MKRLMTVDEAKEIYRDRSAWGFVLSDYFARDETMLSYYGNFTLILPLLPW